MKVHIARFTALLIHIPLLNTRAGNAYKDNYYSLTNWKDVKANMSKFSDDMAGLSHI